MMTIEASGTIVFLASQSSPQFGFLFGCTLPEIAEKEILFNSLNYYLKEHELDKLIKKIMGENADIEMLVKIFNEDRKENPFFVEMNQMKHNLTRVEKEYLENKPPGKLRTVTESDYSLLLKMRINFDREIFGSDHIDENRVSTLVHEQIKKNHIFIWEIIDDKGTAIPTAMVGIARVSGQGASIAPVYTFPEHRRKGYATVGVAEVAAYCLNVLQKQYVTLFTDLSNPTSNSIYRKVGFIPDVKWAIYTTIKKEK